MENPHGMLFANANTPTLPSSGEAPIVLQALLNGKSPTSGMPSFPPANEMPSFPPAAANGIPPFLMFNGAPPFAPPNGALSPSDRTVPRVLLPGFPEGGDALPSLDGPNLEEKMQNLMWAKWSDVVFGFAKSMTLKAILELNIPNILAMSGGQLSLDEIAAKLPSKTLQMDYLDRIMTFACISEIFMEFPGSSQQQPEGPVEIGKRRFALSPLAGMLVDVGPAKEMSFAAMTRYLLSKNAIDAWMTFSKAVLTGAEPIHLAHGKSMWEVARDDPEWGNDVNDGMALASRKIMTVVMKDYRGFEGVKQLVDVGGGTGASLSIIRGAYPHIKGINFDLPQVIDKLPETPGVEQASGDMFKSVPEGDAIFMKWILHDWSDEQCVKILKNCHKSLPNSGKVILVEQVLREPKMAPEYVMDLNMLAHTSGKERTSAQWHRILKSAGFPRVSIIAIKFSGASVIEGHKTT